MEIKKGKYTQNIDVSIIIVNWNAGKFLKETIESIYEKTSDINYEIILVDNNSYKEDESFLYIERTLQGKDNTTIINSSQNLGFAKANNIGLKLAQGKKLPHFKS